jgi:hypothetical protein
MASTGHIHYYKIIPALPRVLVHLFLPVDTMESSALVPDFLGRGRAVLKDNCPHARKRKWPDPRKPGFKLGSASNKHDPVIARPLAGSPSTK